MVEDRSSDKYKSHLLQTDSKFSLSNEKRKASSLILHIMCDIDQEQTNHLENCIEESNVFGSMNDEVSNMEEEDKSKNDENSEGNSDHLNTQATTESKQFNIQTS